MSTESAVQYAERVLWQYINLYNFTRRVRVVFHLLTDNYIWAKFPQRQALPGSLVTVHAKGVYFEYSVWTDNVDFVHICYIQCDLFDCCIFRYEIMPATLANTFLFILQSSALADLRYGGRL